MLRNLFKGALDSLKICTKHELQNMYQWESEKDKPNALIFGVNRTKELEKLELNVILKNLDKPLMMEESNGWSTEDVPFDIDALVAKIDAKIAELELEEQRSRETQTNQEFSDSISALQTQEIDGRAFSQDGESILGAKNNGVFAWISDLAPRRENSPQYCFEYLKTVLHFLVKMGDVGLSVNALNKKAKNAIVYMQNGSIRTIYWELLDLAASLYHNNEQDVQKCTSRVKRRIRKELRKYTEKTEFDFTDLVQIRIYRDILFLVLAISKYTASHNYEQNQTEALAYIYYYLAENFYGKKESSPAEGLYYAKLGLALTDPLDRQDSFNTLGVCAVDTRGNKQLAYDAYYSWIHKVPVGLIVELLPDNFSFGRDDDIWRQEKVGRERTALMYGNFSYTCGVIADTYEPHTERWQIFIYKAVEYIKKALNLRDTLEEKDSQQYSNYFCTYGTLLSQLNKPDSSYQDCIEQYQNYYDFSDNKSDKLSAARHLCEVMLDDSLSRLLNECGSEGNYYLWPSKQKNKDIYEKLLQVLDTYKKILADAKEDPTVDESEKKAALEPFFELQDKLTNADWEIQFALLMIWHLAATIISHLKRHEYSRANYFTRIKREDVGISAERPKVGTIAYYTTLKTATYLFNVLYRENSYTAPYLVTPEKKEQYKSGKNCLTMMHAHYMNDPYEGLALGDCVGGVNQHANILFYRGNTARFREDIFERYFVFLKSFTDRTDDLLMWNRYSSDRNSGSRDSNGCFIQFNTDSFDRVNNSDGPTKNKLLLDDADDYALYRVVYISKEGTILDEKNRGLSNYVKLGYEMLIGLLRGVNDYLSNRCTDGKEDEQVDWVRKFVQAALRDVIFLFKDDDYADELEYRLIVSRTHNQLDCIHMIPGDPDKVSINPYFQMCIDRVILGPNVENADSWITYFRYHLSRMWQRTLEGKVKEPKFTIEKSKIHYHT